MFLIMLYVCTGLLAVLGLHVLLRTKRVMGRRKVKATSLYELVGTGYCSHDPRNNIDAIQYLGITF